MRRYGFFAVEEFAILVVEVTRPENAAGLRLSADTVEKPINGWFSSPPVSAGFGAVNRASFSDISRGKVGYEDHTALLAGSFDDSFATHDGLLVAVVKGPADATNICPAPKFYKKHHCNCNVGNAAAESVPAVATARLVRVRG